MKAIRKESRIFSLIDPNNPSKGCRHACSLRAQAQHATHRYGHHSSPTRK